MLVPNKRGVGRVEEDGRQGGTGTHRPVPRGRKDKRGALLRAVIEAADSEDSKEGAGSCHHLFSRVFFCQISTAPLDN